MKEKTEESKCEKEKKWKICESPYTPGFEYNFVSLLKTHMAKLGVLTRKLLFGQCIH